MLLVLPLFPGQPLLGPIYVQVDRFMPPDFPLLLIVPAMAIDWVMQRVGRGRARDWALSAIIARAVRRRVLRRAVAVCRFPGVTLGAQ